jgi:hypothetical protein
MVISSSAPMLASAHAHDRPFNACANAPRFTEKSRPDWVVSRNTKPLPIEAHDAILNSARAKEYA